MIYSWYGYKKINSLLWCQTSQAGKSRKIPYQWSYSHLFWPRCFCIILTMTLIHNIRVFQSVYKLLIFIINYLYISLSIWSWLISLKPNPHSNRHNVISENPNYFTIHKLADVGIYPLKDPDPWNVHVKTRSAYSIFVSAILEFNMALTCFDL